MTASPGTALDAAIDAASHALLARQRSDGSWQDHLPSSAVATAMAISALHAAAPYTADPAGIYALVADGAAWLREQQDGDGGWGDAVGAPATLNGSTLADAALRLVDPARSADALRRSRDWLDRHGGDEAVNDRKRCTLSVIGVNLLAAAGVRTVDSLSRPPIELALLPRPLRAKLSFTVPGLMSFGLMHANTRRAGRVRRVANRLARPSAVAYLRQLQDYEDQTGTSLSAPVGGFQESALMTGVVCFGLARSGLTDHDDVRRILTRCVEFLRTTCRPDGSWPVNRDLEFSASMFCAHGLAEAGLDADPRLARTVDWVLASQRRDAFPATGCPPGGWGWSLPSGWPNTDDVTSALLAMTMLHAVRRNDPRRTAATASGIQWLTGMQNRDGSWGCFTRDAPVTLDAPCSIFTAHAVLALQVAAGLGPADPPVARGLDYFRRTARADGSFGSLWYREHTSGTAAVLQAFGRLGLGTDPVAARSRAWLLDRQNPDGGWGDGHGAASTVEETAWAVLGLADATPSTGDERDARLMADAAERGAVRGSPGPSGPMASGSRRCWASTSLI